MVFFDRSSLTLYANKACDCSSVCGAIARLGGYDVDLWGTFYTGNFRARLVAAGFSAIRFHSLSQLQPGDFVLNEGLHVEFVSDWGQMYSASIDENGDISGGKDGDQTGSEVRYRSAYVYYAGWEWILRPPAAASNSAAVVIEEKEDEGDMALRGVQWVRRSDKTLIHALFDTVSGFWQEYHAGVGKSNGMGGGYNNPLAQNWQTGSWPIVTEIHAKGLRDACARVRQGK